MSTRNVIIKETSLAKRCEICHQQDRYDAVKDICSRCSPVQESKGLLKNTSYQFYSRNRSLRLIVSGILLTFTLFIMLLFVINIWLPALHSLLLFVPGAFSAIFALIAFSIAAYQILGYANFIIDRDKNIITAWRGIYFPIWKNHYQFNDIDRVEICCEIRYHKGQKIISFPVKAYLKKDNRSFMVSKSPDYLASRMHAMKFARLIDANFRDISHGIEIFRAAGTLNSNLRFRLQTNLHPQQLWEEPNNCPIVYEINPHYNSAVFTLPREGFGFKFWIFSTISAFVTVMAIFLFVVLDFQLLIPIILLITALPIILMALYNATLQERIVITAHSFLLEANSCFKKQLLEIPLNELDELELLALRDQASLTAKFDGVNLLAIGEDRVIKFGNSLSAEQAHWLLNTIKYCISLEEKQDSGNK